MNGLSRTLIATAILVALPVVASATCPSYATSGAPLSYSAESAYLPQSTTVVAGGNVDLGTCAEVPGFGHIVESPDFTMQYQDLGMGRSLEIRVNADGNAVLLVNPANGQWLFNDDTNGLNPAIRINGAASGQYDIWVGTFGAPTCNAQLIVETF
mgnify:CR=1 FL=1|jgi:hypothetical protein